MTDVIKMTIRINGVLEKSVYFHKLNNIICVLESFLIKKLSLEPVYYLKMNKNAVLQKVC